MFLTVFEESLISQQATEFKKIYKKLYYLPYKCSCKVTIIEDTVVLIINNY